MGNNFSKSSFDKNQEEFDENEREFRKASQNRGLKCMKTDHYYFNTHNQQALNEKTAYGYSKGEMDNKEFSSHPASCSKYWNFLTSV